MKIQRYNGEHAFWRHVRRVLPKSMYAVVTQEGYGTTFHVTLRESAEGWRGLFPGPKIADVKDDFIELYQPQYFSDFEDIIRSYESKTGNNVTLKFWEGD